MSDLLLARLDGRTVSAAEVTSADPRGREPVPKGLYETVLVERDRPLLVEAHARRHAAGCAAIGLGRPDAAALAARMRDAARSAVGRRCRLRLLRWDDDGRIRRLVTLSVEPPPPRDATVGIAVERRDPGAVERRFKRIDAPDLERARLRSRRMGHFDEIVLDESGTILEGAKTTVFWRTGRALHTPPTSLPILPGVRRGWMMQVARRAGLEVHETAALLEDLLAADEILLTNAIVRVLRRVRIVC